MSFSYSTSLATDTHRVRFHIGDTDVKTGPRPNNATYSDEEIAAVIAYEGSWERAVAALFETLSAEWRLHPTFAADQFTISNSHIPRGYAEEAKNWRERHGWSGDATRRSATSFSPVRVDWYSDDLTVSGE